MKYEECTALIDFLNERFCKAGMQPWYKWAVDISWGKLKLWGRMLGYEVKK